MRGTGVGECCGNYAASGCVQCGLQVERVAFVSDRHILRIVRGVERLDRCAEIGLFGIAQVRIEQLVVADGFVDEEQI